MNWKRKCATTVVAVLCLVPNLRSTANAAVLIALDGKGNAFANGAQATPNRLARLNSAFNGWAVTNITTPNPDRGFQSFKDEAFSTHAFDLSSQSLGPALATLTTSSSEQRYLNLMAVPYDYDPTERPSWFDDSAWTTISGNMRVAGSIVQQTGMRGILLDTEMYNLQPTGQHPYNYQNAYGSALINDPAYAGKTYAQVRAMVEQRGKEVIQAINAEDPNIEILLTESYEWAGHENYANLQGDYCGLLAAFLDGMLHNSTPGTVFIDGHEDYAYASGTYQDGGQALDYYGDRLYHERHDAVDYGLTAYPADYLQKFRAGISISPTFESYEKAYQWCGSAQILPYAPDQLAYMVQQAVKESDGYVWFWMGGGPNIWSDPIANPPTGGIFPQVYADAIKRGEARGSNPQLPQLTEPLPGMVAHADAADVCKATPVQLSNYVVTLVDGGLNVTWHSDQLSPTQVDYGPTAAYGSQTQITEPDGATEHSVVISAQAVCSTLHFSVLAGATIGDDQIYMSPGCSKPSQTPILVSNLPTTGWGSGEVASGIAGLIVAGYVVRKKFYR